MHAIKREYDIFVAIYKANKGQYLSYIFEQFVNELYKLGCPDYHAQYCKNFISQNVNLKSIPA